MNGADEFDKKIRLKALQNVVDAGKERRQVEELKRRATVDQSKNLAKGSLDKDVIKVSSSGVDNVTPIKNIVGKTEKLDTIGEKLPFGKTDVIDTLGEEQKIVSGQEFQDNIQKALKENEMKRAIRRGDNQLASNLFKEAIEAGDEGMMSKFRSIAKQLGSAGRTGLKQVPLIGGIAAAALAGSEDASAAIPILDSAESAGMSPQAENELMSEIQARKDYDSSQAKKDRLAALAKLMKSGQ